MKKSIFILAVLFALTNQLFAQETITKQRTKSNNTNERDGSTNQWPILAVKISPTENGCSIVFGNDVATPRDAQSGMATGKRGYYQSQSSFSVSALDNSITEVKSPRDAASGLPTGRRMHKPITVSKEYDKSSPMLAKRSSNSNTASDGIAIDEPGVQKVSIQDFHFTVRCGGKSTPISCVDGECEIPTNSCPDGTCSVTADWSWGMSQSGSANAKSGSSRCSVDFLLEIEDGVCTRMAINEKGTGGT
ncbi:MAG: type VI secretion system tube protein Hcp, partial [Flavobacterium sp.]|uniref:type VI secretion system tube protein Hcp n=1 Tax=Flavobacterium sp. TaxID=239 RepID=UPI00261736A6